MWDELFKSEIPAFGLNKEEMFEMLSLTLKNCIILTDIKYYSQTDRIFVGFMLGPTLANIFFCYHESNWLKNCLKDFKPVYYKRCAGDTFILLNIPEHAQFFLEYI